MLRAERQLLAETEITLSFASEVTWCLDTLVDDIVHWLSTSETSTTSKIGIFSSPQFHALIGTFLNEKTIARFQNMVYAKSLAYTQFTTGEENHQEIQELGQIGAVSGHDFLEFLDGCLIPDAFKSFSKTDLQSLFLLLVGTILAVGYSGPFEGDPVGDHPI